MKRSRKLFGITLCGLFLDAMLISAANAGPDYFETLPRFWGTLYPDGGRTLYCDVAFRPYDDRVNVEHVFPRAWMAHDLGCGTRDQCRRRSVEFNRIESDMHNLYPSLRSVNKARGSYRFGLLKGERRLERNCDFEINSRARIAEPRPAVRGDVARAMLYMRERYGLEIFRRQLATLVEWHRTDPPDDEERRRNDLIAQVQGNRNPYIDEPDRMPRD